MRLASSLSIIYEGRRGWTEEDGWWYLCTVTRHLGLLLEESLRVVEQTARVRPRLRHKHPDRHKRSASDARLLPFHIHSGASTCAGLGRYITALPAALNTWGVDAP
jgi:hypothetical protein